MKSGGIQKRKKKVENFSFCCTYMAKFLSRKHLFLSSPAQSCTPTIPKMKKTKKQSRRTLPNIGRVSSSSVTRILIPGREGKTTSARAGIPIPTLDVQKNWGVVFSPKSLRVKREVQMPKARQEMGTKRNLQRVGPGWDFQGFSAAFKDTRTAGQFLPGKKALRNHQPPEELLKHGFVNTADSSGGSQKLFP